MMMEMKIFQMLSLREEEIQQVRQLLLLKLLTKIKTLLFRAVADLRLVL